MPGHYCGEVGGGMSAGEWKDWDVMEGEGEEGRKKQVNLHIYRAWVVLRGRSLKWSIGAFFAYTSYTASDWTLFFEGIINRPGVAGAVL